MLRRSLVIALIVGIILTAINQGNVILGGDFPPSLYWKIPLTYCVPFAVATTGAYERPVHRPRALKEDP